MLEEHVLPWIRMWEVGFGLLGEEGAESIHTYFNGPYSGIPDSLRRLKQIMTEHHFHVAPANTIATPPVKKRKLLSIGPEE